jgi:hypothetical protein
MPKQKQTEKRKKQRIFAISQRSRPGRRFSHVDHAVIAAARARDIAARAMQVAERAVQANRYDITNGIGIKKYAINEKISECIASSDSKRKHTDDESESGVYWGELKDGNFHGLGVFRFDDGISVNEGEWENGELSGYGVCRFKDDEGDEILEGEFKDTKLNGYAIYRYSDGRVHRGQWKDDLPNGQGFLRLTSGRSYEGTWIDGVMHGSFVFRAMSSGCFRIEEFRNGTRVSTGGWRLPNGGKVYKKPSNVRPNRKACVKNLWSRESLVDE